MKKALVTVQVLAEFSGSELHAIQIAEQFVKNDYDTYLMTSYVSDANLELCTSKGIKVFDWSKITELPKVFDVIWAHHYPTLDVLLGNLNITSTHIIYNSLSSFADVEKLPEYYVDLSLIVCVSKETALAHKKNQGCNNSEILLNYAPESYFRHKKKCRKLRKILVVSNHIPTEVFELESLFLESGYEIDVIGLERQQLIVDDNLLLQYDLVISIGRTVNYCMAIGVPVYCYDHFGGCGYLNSQNIEDEVFYNLSGRNTNRKLTALKLFEEITSGYKSSLTQLKFLKKFAKDNFCLEDGFENIICKLNDSNKVLVDKFLVNPLSYKYLDFLKWYRVCVTHSKNLQHSNEFLTKEIDSLKASQAKLLEKIEKLEKM